jgi:Flp pilus assembly pilin Flp
MRMKTWIKQFLCDVRAATAVEYGLLVALIGITMGLGLTSFTNELNLLMTDIGNSL